VSADYHLLRLEGYLDIGRYPEIRAAFETVPPGPVLIDLQDVVGVDSVFLSEMLLFKRRRRPERVAVVIPPRGHLAKIFSIASIGQKLDVFPDLSAAIASLGVPSLAEPEDAAAGESPEDRVPNETAPE
jgi:anti-anti-sigma regulatory factor